MRLFPVISTILNFESIYLTQILTMLVYFADMQLRLQQIRMLAHNMALFLHYIRYLYKIWVTKIFVRYNLITTNCDHIANKKKSEKK